MLCILAMFAPTFFMIGAGKAMFLPLSVAVGFSMIASYLLSSSLVPILSVWFLRGHEHPKDSQTAPETAFAKFRKRYATLLTGVVRFRWLVLGLYLIGAALIIFFIGCGLG